MQPASFLIIIFRRRQPFRSERALRPMCFEARSDFAIQNRHGADARAIRVVLPPFRTGIAVDVF